MIYVFLADGFEELEAFAPVDILRRGGCEVLTVGVTGKCVTGSHGIKTECDTLISDITLSKSVEAIVLPGGMPGTLNLEKSKDVQDVIDYCYQKNIIIGAICAAPSILGHKGILEGKKATCFNGFEKDLLGADIISEPVVRDKNIITAFGAGAAFPFGFELLGAVKSKNTAEKIRISMRYGE